MRLLRRYSWWIVGCAVLCVAVVWLVGARKPAQYTSAAGVDVEASAVPYSAATVVNMATEEQVASSGVVLDRAARQLGTTPGQLAPHISTSVKSAANVLTISCTMPDPTAAYHCATAVSRAYVNFRNDVSATPRVRSRDPLAATMVTPAQLPTGPSGLRPLVLLGLAAIVGLLLGAGAAVIRDRADDRVRDRDDLEACLEAPVLATVPPVRRAGHPATTYTATTYTAEPDSAVAEAFRYLRAHLDVLAGRADGGPAKILLVTGAQRGDGRSSVASNLAAALAQAGSRVLLVDADLRRPALGDIFGADIRPGFSDLLAGHTDLPQAAAGTDVPGLSLITAGRLPGRPDLLTKASLQRVAGQLRQAADVVIVDTGPALDVSDALALASQSDLILVTASTRSSQRQSVRTTAQELRAASQAPVMGVLVEMPSRLAVPQLTWSRPEAYEHSDAAHVYNDPAHEHNGPAYEHNDAAQRLAHAEAGGRR